MVCMNSTAQQARPKVIGQSEPVRAQLMMLSELGDDEALVVQLVAHQRKRLILGRTRRQRLTGQANRGGFYSHSSAPFFHS